MKTNKICEKRETATSLIQETGKPPISPFFNIYSIKFKCKILLEHLKSMLYILNTTDRADAEYIDKHKFLRNRIYSLNMR